MDDTTFFCSDPFLMLSQNPMGFTKLCPNQRHHGFVQQLMKVIYIYIYIYIYLYKFIVVPKKGSEPSRSQSEEFASGKIKIRLPKI